jgi:hypothetical protein
LGKTSRAAQAYPEVQTRRGAAASGKQNEMRRCLARAIGHSIKYTIKGRLSAPAIGALLSAFTGRVDKTGVQLRATLIASITETPFSCNVRMRSPNLSISVKLPLHLRENTDVAHSLIAANFALLAQSPSSEMTIHVRSKTHSASNRWNDGPGGSGSDIHYRKWSQLTA